MQEVRNWGNKEHKSTSQQEVQKFIVETQGGIDVTCKLGSNT